MDNLNPSSSVTTSKPPRYDKSQSARALRLVNALVGAVERLTNHTFFTLTADAAIKKVQKQTGLTDFGDDNIRTALQMICQTITAAPRLTPLGRKTKRDLILHNLRTRLRMTEKIKETPAILKEDIRQPWFILGLPRTGTTLLHRLLAQDPAFRAPLFWEVEVFFTRPLKSRPGLDPRIKFARRNLQLINFIVPEFKAIHEIGAELPEECVGILNNGLVSSAWIDLSDETLAWVKTQDMTNSYRIHKQYLQTMQHGTATRTWLLKSPIHLYYLDVLLKTYPDARIIQTHRDPAEVLPSMASFASVVSNLRYDHLDLNVVGERILRDLASVLERGMQIRKEKPDGSPAGHLYHDVRYSDLVKDPMGVVTQIYAAFGRELTAEARQKMEAYLVENRQHKFGRHRYSLEDFGIDKDEVTREFAGYRDRYLSGS